MKKYESEHPGFVPPTIKTLITKNDRHVLEKYVIQISFQTLTNLELYFDVLHFLFSFSGKPKKPPCNAYSLYSVIMLQSAALKAIPSKEKMAEIAKRWKSLDQSGKEQYAIQLQKVKSFFFSMN